jgi:hypothetical protein
MRELEKKVNNTKDYYVYTLEKEIVEEIKK